MGWLHWFSNRLALDFGKTVRSCTFFSIPVLLLSISTKFVYYKMFIKIYKNSLYVWRKNISHFFLMLNNRDELRLNLHGLRLMVCYIKRKILPAMIIFMTSTCNSKTFLLIYCMNMSNLRVLYPMKVKNEVKPWGKGNAIDSTAR